MGLDDADADLSFSHACEISRMYIILSKAHLAITAFLPEPQTFVHKKTMVPSLRDGVMVCTCQGVSADRNTPFFNKLVSIGYGNVKILFFVSRHDADIQVEVKGISDFHAGIGIDAQNQVAALKPLPAPAHPLDSPPHSATFLRLHYT